jgi:2-phosphoglycerate kinase
MFMGCKLSDTQRISSSIFSEVTAAIQASVVDTEETSQISSVTIPYSYLTFLATQALTSIGYSPLHIRDFEIGCEIVSHRRSITVLLGGTSGTGKSTLSSLVASRLGISTVLSTDSIRHIMRNFIDPKSNPVLFASTYEAGKFIIDPSLTDKQKVLEGHTKQCEYVYDNLSRLIRDFQERRESLVIEGVHLSVSVMKKLMVNYPSCVPFIVCIKNKVKHLERFAVRSKQMTLDPRVNRYVAHFSNIRAIQKKFVDKADEALIPKVDNSNLDRSLGIVHAVIIRVLRRMSEGSLAYDQRRKQCSVVHEEFNQVTTSVWSTKAAQALINDRINKGEVFKRFFNSSEVPATTQELVEQLDTVKSKSSNTESIEQPDIGSLKSGSEQFDVSHAKPEVHRRVLNMNGSLESLASQDEDVDSLQGDSQDSFHQSDSENSVHEETTEMSADYTPKSLESAEHLSNFEGRVESSHSAMLIKMSREKKG